MSCTGEQLQRHILHPEWQAVSRAVGEHNFSLHGVSRAPREARVLEHQHLAEITRTIKGLQPSFDYDINFVPVRGDFARGIFASVYTDCDLSEEQAVALYKEFYADAAFTFVSERNVDLKQVVNTNKAVVQVAKHGSKLHIISVIDNLLKGASGQAVQNMNIMFGFEENLGLNLKPSGF